MNTDLYGYYENFLKENLLDRIPSSVLLDLPTGSGKTYNTFKSVYENLKNDEKAVFIMPLRASVLELYDKFKGFHGVSVKIGGFRAGASLKKAKITITTPEAIFGIFSEWKKNIVWISKLKYLVVDEIHLISQKDRGWLSEILLSRVMRVNPFCKIITLSATPGKSRDFLRRTGAVAVRNTRRPVPLEIRLQTYSNKDQNKNKDKILISLLEKGKSSIVFVHGRKKSEKLSGFLCENNIKADFHHAGLSRKLRKQKEDLFKQGKINVLIATPTLENGVNLPARQVILYDLYYVEDDNPVLIDPATLMQRLGRAGRPEFDEKGTGIILVSERDRKAQELIYQDFNDISSSNTIDKTKLFVLYEVNDFYSATSASLKRAWKTLPASSASGIPDFDNVVSELENDGFLYLKNNKFHTSPVVKTALRHFGDPFFFKYIADFMQYSLSITDLLILAAVSLKGGLPRVDENDVPGIIKFYFETETKFLSNGKLIKQLLKSGKTLSNIMEALNVIRFLYFEKAEEEDTYDIQRIKEEIFGILRGFSRFSTFSEMNLCENYELKIKIASFCTKGIPPQSAGMCLIKGIGEKRAKLLIKNGVKTLKQLSETSPEQLAEIGLPRKTSEISPGKAEFFMKNLNPEQKNGFKRNKKFEPCVMLDIYRFERALSLSVTHLSDEKFIVRGGQNEHFTDSGICDCPDFANGNICKHLIAVAVTKIRSSNKYDLDNENTFYLFLRIIRDCKIFNRV